MAHFGAFLIFDQLWGLPNIVRPGVTYLPNPPLISLPVTDVN